MIIQTLPTIWKRNLYIAGPVDRAHKRLTHYIKDIYESEVYSFNSLPMRLVPKRCQKIDQNLSKEKYDSKIN